MSSDIRCERCGASMTPNAAMQTMTAPKTWLCSACWLAHLREVAKGTERMHEAHALIKAGKAAAAILSSQRRLPSLPGGAAVVCEKCGTRHPLERRPAAGETVRVICMECEAILEGRTPTWRVGAA